jgi:phage FluMu protein Com
MRDYERKDYRCVCNRKLFRAWLPIGTYLEIRCPKCRKDFVVNIESKPTTTRLERIAGDGKNATKS